MIEITEARAKARQHGTVKGLGRRILEVIVLSEAAHHAVLAFMALAGLALPVVLWWSDRRR